MNREVSIIIPLYGRLEYTKKCLKCILCNTSNEIDYEIILVNDNSPDDTLYYCKYIAERIDKISYLSNNINRGYAFSNNLGAITAKGKYLVFLNNDTEVQKGWLDNLINVLKLNEDIGIVGAKLFYPNYKVQHCGKVWTYNEKIGYRNIHIYLGEDFYSPAVNKDRCFQMVTGACMAMRNKEFISIKGFDEQFKNGYEDDDICYKFSNIGKKIFYCSKSHIMHHENISLPENQNVINDTYNRSRFLGKWGNCIERDDFKYYCEDDKELIVQENNHLVFSINSAEKNKIYENIAIVCLVRGGDVFLTTSLLPEIRNKHKNAIITYITSPNFKQILEGNPNIDNIKVFGNDDYCEDSWYQTVNDCNDYDKVYKLQPLPALGNFFFTTLRDGSMHLLDIISSIGGVYHNNNKPYININNEIKHKDNFINKWSLNKNSKYIIFNIYSADKIKNWDIAELHKLIHYMSAFSNEYEFILLGDEQSRKINIKNLINLSGKTTIKEAAMMVSQADLFIGVDSMLAHFTSINNTKSIFLFSPTTPYYSGPINDSCVYLIKPEMNSILSDDVFKCVRMVLNNKINGRFELLEKGKDSLIENNFKLMDSHAQWWINLYLEQIQLINHNNSSEYAENPVLKI